MTATEIRHLAVDYMSGRKQMNEYTQGDKRVYFFGYPNNIVGNTTQHGFSDCSSSVRACIKAAAGIDIGWNTDQQIRNRAKGLIVEIPVNGMPNASKLLPADCLYFGGNASHIMQVGHVEMYGGSGVLWGHGGGIGPTQRSMASYCKSRPCIMVIRWILGDDQESEPSTLRPTLRYGDCGDYVHDMQVLLIDQEYDLGRWGADGEFGAKTKQALEQFQTEHGLKVDGVCGPETWAALESWAAGDPQPSEPELGYITVKAGTWHVRTGPGTNYQSVGYVKAGERLKRTEESATGWLGVEYKGQPRWISEKAVTVDG